jgi:hypothetical protein
MESYKSLRRRRKQSIARLSASAFVGRWDRDGLVVDLFAFAPTPADGIGEHREGYEQLQPDAKGPPRRCRGVSLGRDEPSDGACEEATCTQAPAGRSRQDGPLCPSSGRRHPPNALASCKGTHKSGAGPFAKHQ